MIPIVTPTEMAAIDATAPESVEVLVGRAGAAVAIAARQMMGGTYGRRVLVAAGTGNNGADGRVAADVLTRWGARCRVATPSEALDLVLADTPTPAAATWDLVIDAAYGTGLRGAWGAVRPPAAAVLAVDLPSGVDAVTGFDHGCWPAAATVTFGALKPGLLLHPGAALAGDVQLAPIGLDTGTATSWLVTDADARAVLPVAEPTAHKWRRAVRVIAGSPQMRGAGHLVCAAAQQAGGGMVVISSPGLRAAEVARPAEAVARDLPAGDWSGPALSGIERFGAAVIGPGIGADPSASSQMARFIAECPVPLVIDADALSALADCPECLSVRTAPTVLTPHDGEFAKLTGKPPAADRFETVRQAASGLGAVVLLKGTDDARSRAPIHPGCINTCTVGRRSGGHFGDSSIGNRWLGRRACRRAGSGVGRRRDLSRPRAGPLRRRGALARTHGHLRRRQQRLRAVAAHGDAPSRAARAGASRTRCRCGSEGDVTTASAGQVVESSRPAAQRDGEVVTPQPHETDTSQLRPTWCEIDLAALERNLAAIRRHCDGAQVMPVVKANAYGHGIAQVGRALQAAGVSCVAVAYVEEALALRSAGVTIDIHVLGGAVERQIPLFLSHRLIFTVPSIDKLHQIDEAAAAASTTARAHLKLDTGMGRIGVRPDSADGCSLHRCAAARFAWRACSATSPTPIVLIWPMHAGRSTASTRP